MFIEFFNHESFLGLIADRELKYFFTFVSQSKRDVRPSKRNYESVP